MKIHLSSEAETRLKAILSRNEGADHYVRIRRFSLGCGV